MSNPQRREHLTTLIGKYERMPPWDRSRRGKFPALYYAMATLLSQQGEGEQALSFLEKAEPDSGSEGIHYLIRGRILELMERSDEALESYLRAFSYDLRPDMWSEVRALARKRGVEVDGAVARVLEVQQERAIAFPSFALKTPGGEARSLQNYDSRAILVNFFFPG